MNEQEKTNGTPKASRDNLPSLISELRCKAQEPDWGIGYQEAMEQESDRVEQMYRNLKPYLNK